MTGQQCHQNGFCVPLKALVFGKKHNNKPPNSKGYEPMKTVANLFSTAYTRLGADHQQDRHFMTIERLSPEEDGYCTYVKSVEGLAQNEYWIAREKNILMLLKKTPHIVRLRREEEKSDNSYQTVKTKDSGISLAHWLRTKPTLAASQKTLKHPFEAVGSFLNLSKFCLIALKGMHQMGVVHANLRPDNICIPYAPYPYEFDTELKLDYEGLTLIDFMFSISNTLKLSRPLPISIATTSSPQSSQMLHALAEDRKNRNTDFIQRIDYSVDLYALGFILEQIFQQNLQYPEGLEAELSMEIHRLINELKSYEHGMPESVKMHYLNLLPHDDYIKRIEHLLSLDYRAVQADAQLFHFDPAQFLEDESLFSSDNGLLLETDLEKTPTNDEELPLQLTASTHREKTTMKDTMPSHHTAKDNTADNSYIEIEKSTVITLIVTGQLLFFIFQEGNSLGYDVLSSSGLILLIGLSIAFAGKLFTPKPAPRLRPLIIEPIQSDKTETSVSQSAMTDMDEIDLIAASVATATVAMATKNPEPAVIDEPTPVVNGDMVESAPVIAATVNTDDAPVAVPLVKPTTDSSNVILLKTASTPVTPAKEDDHIEINKWAVIAAILAFQLSYFFLTTNLSGSTTPPVANATPEPAVEAAPIDVAPIEPETVTVEEPVVEETPVATIDLLNEKTPANAPQVATSSKKSTLSDAKKQLAVNETAVKEKTAKDQAITVEKTTEPPVAPVAETAPVTPVAAATPTAVVDAKTDPKSVASNKSLTRGLAEAQNTMGWHYYHGDGVKQDYEESFKWFQKAANLGEPNAQFNVGMMYAAGTGAKQDLIEAAKWYKKSAEQGKTSAQLNLGMMYVSGRGIRQNLPEGVKWLSKAAEQGDTTAKANLTWLTQQGYLNKVIPAADNTTEPPSP
jgi:serine/threonine protein kinase